MDDTDITLREFGYYIYQVEEFVQRQALLYDPENPKQWWNTHFSAGMDSQFVCDYAKKVAVNLCISDEIYYKRAVSSGMVLDSNEEQQAADEARKVYRGLTTAVISKIGLNEDAFVNLRVKHALASKYAESLSKSLDFSGYSGETAELLNWDGAYYQDKILPEHVVTTNEELLEKITLGKITVN